MDKPFLKVLLERWPILGALAANGLCDFCIFSRIHKLSVQEREPITARKDPFGATHVLVGRQEVAHFDKVPVICTCKEGTLATP